VQEAALPQEPLPPQQVRRLLRVGLRTDLLRLTFGKRFAIGDRLNVGRHHREAPSCERPPGREGVLHFLGREREPELGRCEEVKSEK
jgi:hypothetical protein